MSEEQKAAKAPEEQKAAKAASKMVKVSRRGVTVTRTEEEAAKMVEASKKDKFHWVIV